MKSSPLIAIVLVILIAVAAYTYFSGASAPLPATTDTSATGNGESDVITEDSDLHKVTYTEAGFSPASITVKKGESVTFVNEGDGRMWVGADEHPTHTEYDGTSRSEHCMGGASASFDQCGTGDSYTFTFQKVGTWHYHNHALANHEGTIVVTE